MSDPGRLADGDELARLLIGSASDDMPSPEGRARARSAALSAAVVALGVGASAGLVSSGANATSKLGAWAVLKWVALAGVPTALLAGGVARWQTPDVPAAPAVVRAAAPARQSAPPLPAPAITVQAPDPSVEAPAKPAPAAAARVSAQPSLQAEITALDAARHALARGDSSVLDRYLAEHPRGALREQALWMKVSNLEQAGRRAEARAAAKRLLASYPGGAFAARARAVAER